MAARPKSPALGACHTPGACLYAKYNDKKICLPFQN